MPVKNFSNDEVNSIIKLCGWLIDEQLTKLNRVGCIYVDTDSIYYFN